MTLEQKIISYLHSATKGIVKICPATAAHIIDMVLEPGKCKVIFRRYHNQQSNYETIRVTEVSAAIIDSLLKDALENKPVEMFYRYDLYNEINELQGYIYSLNSNLI